MLFPQLLLQFFSYLNFSSLPSNKTQVLKITPNNVSSGLFLQIVPFNPWIRGMEIAVTLPKNNFPVFENWQ
jgi:hypothetical protein